MDSGGGHSVMLTLAHCPHIYFILNYLILKGMRLIKGHEAIAILVKRLATAVAAEYVKSR